MAKPNSNRGLKGAAAEAREETRNLVKILRKPKQQRSVKEVRAIRCRCGQKGCSTWMLNVGTFYTGSGFDRSTAQFIARAINAHLRYGGQMNSARNPRAFGPGAGKMKIPAALRGYPRKGR